MTREEHKSYCEKHGASIFVRSRDKNGKYGNIAIADLEEDERDYWIERWWEDNFTPFRVKTESGEIL